MTGTLPVRSPNSFQMRAFIVTGATTTPLRWRKRWILIPGKGAAFGDRALQHRDEVAEALTLIEGVLAA
ncbi:MAG: hypothetical protein CM15mP103_06600 [Gammaproteobacteria bacterium]|nr:MAG: hypothetical protein CM15mP103_06600 [Gammaproteobacteria bacterium]